MFALCTIEFDPFSNIQSWRPSSSFVWEFFQSLSLFPMLSNLALSAHFIRALLVFVPGLLMQMPNWQFVGPIWKDPRYQPCPALGCHQCLSKTVHGPAACLARAKLQSWAAAALSLLCVPALPQQVSLLLAWVFEGETFMFASSAEKVLCSLPLVPSVNMTVVMFTLPVLHLFQFVAFWVRQYQIFIWMYKNNQ